MEAQDISNTNTAKAVINAIQYITIATVDSSGQPWNAPVYCAFDENYNFYWASSQESQHSENISANNKIFLVIYDSTSPEGRTENGVYMLAKAYQIDDPVEINKAIKYMYERKSKQPKKVEDFMGDAPRRVYKAIPKKVWLNVFLENKGRLVDQRVEVKLAP